MTILKRVTLSLAIAPLVVSIAFATDANDPINEIDIIIKKPKVVQAYVERPAITQETRVIKQQSIRPLTQVNPTDPSVNKVTYNGHNQKISECESRMRQEYRTGLHGGMMIGVACAAKRDDIDFTLTPLVPDVPVYESSKE